MTDPEQSIERLTAWIAECGHNKRREFTSDLVTVLEIARVAVLKTELRSEHNADCVVDEPPPRDAMAASIAAQIEGGR